MAKIYIVREYGPHWIVSESDREVTRYRKDEIATEGGGTNIDELKREIRADLRLKRSDRLMVEA